jgi:hypothetical protein
MKRIKLTTLNDSSWLNTLFSVAQVILQNPFQIFQGTMEPSFLMATQANLGQRMDLRFERSTLLESPKVFGSPKQKAVPSGLNTAPAVCLLSFHGFHMVSHGFTVQIISNPRLWLDHAGSHIEAPGLMTITITTISDIIMINYDQYSPLP